MKPEVKVKVKIKEVEIELTLDEAAELGEVLRRLAGGKDLVYDPYFPLPPQPYYPPFQPYWTPVWFSGVTTVWIADQTGGSE